MKKVLFISLTEYNFDKENQMLEKKFSGLSRGIEIFLIGRGKFSRVRKYQSNFYLIPYLFGFWYILVFFLALFICFSKKIDTIITQSPLLDGFLGVLLKKLTGKELIVEFHGDVEKGAFLVKKRRPEFLLKRLIPLMEGITFRNADKIRAISNSTKEKAQSYASEKPFFVFPTFTDLDMFLEEKITKFENFILFVGALQKRKGVEYLIEAFSKIEKEFTNFKLILIGDGPEKENLRSQISNLKIENKVELKGHLSLEETKDIMKNCYLLVLPSLSEGLGRVLMEAAALGKPLIASNVEGIPDLVKDGLNGFLVKPGSVEDLEEKLRILLENKQMTMDMGTRGKDFIKNNFSNEKYLLSYLAMINT